MPQTRGGYVETIAVRTRQPRECTRWGSCIPLRTAVGFRKAPFSPARSWSRTRLKLFIMMSLPLVNSPKRENGGLVRELSTGTLEWILAGPVARPARLSGLTICVR